MGSVRKRQSSGTSGPLPWETVIDDGTMCRQRTPAPGVIGRSDARLEKCPFQCKVQAEPSAPGAFTELMVIEGKEWAKFLTSVGANVASPVKDTVTDLYQALKKLGITGKASIRVIKGKEYVVIAGYAGLRKILNAPKYLATNVKVADLVIGAAKLGKSAVKGTALSIVLVSSADILENILDDKGLLEKELGFKVMTNVSKAAISGIVGFIGSVAISAMGAPVVLPIAAGIVIGIVVGMALDAVFPTDEIVKAISDYYEEMTQALWSRGVRALYQFQRELLWRVWPHDQMPFPY